MAAIGATEVEGRKPGRLDYRGNQRVQHQWCRNRKRHIEGASVEAYARDGKLHGLRLGHRYVACGLQGQLVYVEEVLVPNLPDAGGVLHEARKDIGGFKKFILRGNVVDLAIGVVIGSAFGNVVQALVKDIIQPLIGTFGGPNAAGLTFTVGRVTFQVGDLITAVMSFVLIALVVYFLVVLPVNKLMDRYKPQPQPAPTKDCPECTSKIPEAARRCPECSAQLLPPSDVVASAMRLVAAPSGADIADHAAKVLAERLLGRDGS